MTDSQKAWKEPGLEELNVENAALKERVAIAEQSYSATKYILGVIESQLCRAREIEKSFPVPVDQHDTDFQKGFAEGVTYVVKEALSSSPCPHAKEAERLREAVEWVLNQMDGMERMQFLFNELLRRAEGGE